MHSIQRGPVLLEFARDLYMRQRHTAKNRPHHLRRRLCRLPSRLSWGNAFERRACLLQMAPHTELPQHQHAQRDAQLAESPNDPTVVMQKQWCQRPSTPFQLPEALFDLVLATLCRHALS